MTIFKLNDKVLINKPGDHFHKRKGKIVAIKYEREHIIATITIKLSRFGLLVEELPQFIKHKKGLFG